MFAVKAAEALRQKGFDAVVLRDSVQDWKSMGFPVDSGPETTKSTQGKGR
jgi:rhodanese-related sulfurtransferase